MAGMSGFEVLSALRVVPEWAQIPVVLTGMMDNPPRTFKLIRFYRSRIPKSPPLFACQVSDA